MTEVVQFEIDNTTQKEDILKYLESILGPLTPESRARLRSLSLRVTHATQIQADIGAGSQQRDNLQEKVKMLEKLVKESRLSELPKLFEEVDEMRKCLPLIMEPIEFKQMPIEAAVNVVRDYVKNHPGCKTNDIIIALRIDPEIVIEALSILEKQDKIEGREVERGPED